LEIVQHILPTIWARSLLVLEAYVESAVSLSPALLTPQASHGDTLHRKTCMTEQENVNFHNLATR